MTASVLLLKNLLGMKLKIVQGYRSPGDVVLAVTRGEVGGFVNSVGGPVGARTASEIVDELAGLPEKTQVTVLAPTGFGAMWHNTFRGILPWYHNILYSYRYSQLSYMLDAEQRRLALQDLQRQLADDSVNVWLFELPKLGVWKRGLKGLWREAPVQGSVMAAPYPEADGALLNPAAEAEMRLVMETITAIRNLEKSLAANKPRALIQMATGSGKTFTAISFIYRLIKFAGARRVLFLVDRGNLVGPSNPWSAAVDGYRHLPEVATWNQAVHEAVGAELQSGHLPVLLGGDHCLAMGSISAVARHCRDVGKKLRVLWLDAHADFNTSELTPSGNIHGMSLAVSLGFGDPELVRLGHRSPKVLPRNTVLIGIRDIDPGEGRLQRVGRCFPGPDHRARGPARPRQHHQRRRLHGHRHPLPAVGTLGCRRTSGRGTPAHPGTVHDTHHGGAVMSGHIPVMAEAAITQLAPHDGGIYLDGTFGGGGWSRALLASSDCTVWGLDRDPAAIAADRNVPRLIGLPFSSGVHLDRQSISRGP